MIAVFGETVIISKPGRSFPHWLASIFAPLFVLTLVLDLAVDTFCGPIVCWAAATLCKQVHWNGSILDALLFSPGRTFLVL